MSRPGVRCLNPNPTRLKRDTAHPHGARCSPRTSSDIRGICPLAGRAVIIDDSRRGLSRGRLLPAERRPAPRGGVDGTSHPSAGSEMPRPVHLSPSPVERGLEAIFVRLLATHSCVRPAPACHCPRTSCVVDRTRCHKCMAFVRPYVSRLSLPAAPPSRRCRLPSPTPVWAFIPRCLSARTP